MDSTKRLILICCNAFPPAMVPNESAKNAAKSWPNADWDGRSSIGACILSFAMVFRDGKEAFRGRINL
jgi:hypothetical protein